MECCGRVSPTNYHCAVERCHQTFGTLTDFDAHQIHRYNTPQPVSCVPVADFGRLGLTQDDRGTWRTPEGVARLERVRGMVAGFASARRGGGAQAP